MVPQAPSILRHNAVLKCSGKSRSAHYRDIKNGLFTPPIRLSRHTVGWPDYEVAALNRARIAGRSEAQIRALVRELVAARSTADMVGPELAA